MYAEPTDVGRADVIDVVRSHWGVVVSQLHYHPVGFGTHHYIAGEDWFINVDDLRKDTDPDETFERLDRSLRTACALRDHGLDFVLAPVAPADGGALVRLDDRYAVSLYEYVEGTCKTHLDVVTTKERREVLAMLGKVHATTIPDAIPRREDFAVRLRSEFFDALADETSWRSGPFAESAQQLVLSKGSHVRELFDRYDELVNAVSARSQFVVTHGEPHPENVMRLSDGRVCLIDWDTAALAPPERDLWMIEPQSDAEVAAYISSGGVPAIDPDAINLYRRQWTLAEIAIYTKTFRDDHVNDANTQVAWREFQKYVDG